MYHQHFQNFTLNSSHQNHTLKSAPIWAPFIYDFMVFIGILEQQKTL
jgi:hypothetical protein